MKNNSPNKFSRSCSGMSIIELSLVIAVLLGLISVLFIGVTAYKKGVDRARCIHNMNTIQKSVLAYANLNGYNSGANITGLNAILTSEGYFGTALSCPASGTYSYTSIIPITGETYTTCSIAEHDLLPFLQ